MSCHFSMETAGGDLLYKKKGICLKLLTLVWGNRKTSLLRIFFFVFFSFYKLLPVCEQYMKNDVFSGPSHGAILSWNVLTLNVSNHFILQNVGTQLMSSQ